MEYNLIKFIVKETFFFSTIVQFDDGYFVFEYPIDSFEAFLPKPSNIDI